MAPWIRSTELLYLASMKTLDLYVLPKELCVARLPAGAEWPGWPKHGGFYSVTRTEHELSVVCEPAEVPQESTCETGWRAMGVKGPLQFSEVGILAGLTHPLAQARVSVFVISTYDTDYILVKAEQVGRAVEVLRSEGHRVEV